MNEKERDNGAKTSPGRNAGSSAASTASANAARTVAAIDPLRFPDDHGGTSTRDRAGGSEERTRDRGSERASGSAEDRVRRGRELRERAGEHAAERRAVAGTADPGAATRSSNGGSSAAGNAGDSRTAEEITRDTRKPVSRKTVGEPQKLAGIFRNAKGGKVEINEEYVASLWKSCYNVPALAGYGEWWRLHDKEANALAEPSTRIINRMTPQELELFSRFADPVALVIAAIAITGPRIGMTREYIQSREVERKTEARRAALSQSERERIPRSATGEDGDLRRRTNGAHPGHAATDTEVTLPGSGEHVQNAFGED